MKKLLALSMAGMGLALAAHAEPDISIEHGDSHVGPKPRKHKHAARPIVETRQPPKEKSASLRRMLKSKGRK